MKNNVIFPLLILAVSSGQATGEAGDFEQIFGASDELVSLATGTAQPVAQAPAVATVITRAELDAMGARTIDDALRGVPGLHVSVSSNRWTPVYHVRGLATQFNPQVLMLVNGSPITHNVIGNRGFYPVLPIHSISRIEVVRGPGSAVYGPDAMAAVINIVTRSPAEATGDIGLGYGSFDTQTAWSVVPFSLTDALDAVFSVEYRDTDGDADRIIDADAQTAFDTLGFAPPASHAPGPGASNIERLDLRLSLESDAWRANIWHWDVEAGTGPGIAQALDPDGTNTVDNTLVDLRGTWFSGARWKLETTAAWADYAIDTDFRLFPPGTTLPIGPDGNVSPAGQLVRFPDGLRGNPSSFEKHGRLDLIATYEGDKHVWRLAAGGHHVEADTTETKNFGPGVIDGGEGTVDGTLIDVSDSPYVYLAPTDRTTRYISLQDEWRFAPDWRLTAGIRTDDFSDFGTTTNPRLALVWATGYNSTLKLLYGEAFRPPSFFELSAVNNPAVIGNPDLDPESIETTELAFDIRPSGEWRFGVNLFHYDAHDLIEYVPNESGSSSTAQNIGRLSAIGAEFEFAYTFRRYTVGGNLSWQDAERPDGSEAANTPGNMMYLFADWRFAQDWRLHAVIEHIADRVREAGDPREPIDDYQTIDATVKYAPAGPWRLSLSAQNLTDETRREPSPVNLQFPAGSAVPGDYPLPGRSVLLELAYEFE